MKRKHFDFGQDLTSINRSQIKKDLNSGIIVQRIDSQNSTSPAPGMGVWCVKRFNASLHPTKIFLSPARTRLTAPVRGD